MAADSKKTMCSSFLHLSGGGQQVLQHRMRGNGEDLGH
jgi:hypothetical protein